MDTNDQFITEQLFNGREDLLNERVSLFNGREDLLNEREQRLNEKMNNSDIQYTNVNDKQTILPTCHLMKKIFGEYVKLTDNFGNELSLDNMINRINQNFRERKIVRDGGGYDGHIYCN